ncbi:hypothetical protein GW7_01364 [Heterocephalus glaber]|uniref:Uncharacterized protein n=1 Tax=Heterocephalus glaber TaxID=10181 RepID=G5AVI6_HETGA|nr:hypothetical protein GW7_01364 [Heterocephalus glaber]
MKSDKVYEVLGTTGKYKEDEAGRAQAARVADFRAETQSTVLLLNSFRGALGGPPTVHPAGTAVRKAVLPCLAATERKSGKVRGDGAERGKGTECEGAPLLPTCIKLQLVTGQRLERELVTLEAGVQ